MRENRFRWLRRAVAVLALVLVIGLALGAAGLATGQTSANDRCSTPVDATTRADAALRPVDMPGESIFDSRNAPAASQRTTVTADAYGLPLANDDLSRLNAEPSVLLQDGDTLSFTVTVPADGEYVLSFDSVAPPSSNAPEAEVRVDGEFPVPDMQQVRFPIFYRNESDVFPRDRYGNESLIGQEREVRWTTVPVRDTTYSLPTPIQLTLSEGTHTIDLAMTSGSVYLGSAHVTPYQPLPDYAEYRETVPDGDTSGVQIALEAELPSFKNDTTLRPVANRGLTVTPYDTYCLLLNTFGGDSWIESGSSATYLFDVPEAGLYNISLRALQNTRSNFTVFRRVLVNGEVPFEELNAVPFSYGGDWQTVTLGEDEPYEIYLPAGLNSLTLEATASPYRPAIDTIQQALLDINALALEINRLTGNQRDPFKEWDLRSYIPDIEERLNAIAQALIDDKDTLLAIDQSGASPEVLTYQMAIDNLQFLASDPNKIPNYMSRFSEGTGSAAQQLGSLLPLLRNQPLAVDKIDVHSPDSMPETPFVPITTQVTEDLRRFVRSFQPDPYASIGAGEQELEVWVNRSRQYVDLMQQLADQQFTPETGIRVKFSIMPDENKLVLANAAGIQPDVALGVSTDKPYELAIRNALYDLRTFPDFDETIREFQPGSLLGYIIDDSVYALPETQDFWVTFYRRDILESLGLPVPDTWNDVLEILPELQRYGMNYSTPLSSGQGTRNYLFTAPYLFNYDAPLYVDNGFATGLGEENAVEAIRFMTDSFTIYGMPLTTASFFDSFRYGTLPIGISNSETYIKLSTAAPELAGLWDLALYPATVLPDGEENRWTTGSAQTGIIFKDTDQPEEAWEFLKWWMSTETQTAFQEQLLLSFGPEYLWFSANEEAFRRLDIPEGDRAVIDEQRQWVQEPVRLPGSYMQERELSNAWNRVVFDGANVRVAIDRAIMLINREITRKMEEFGYLQDGQRVREFHVPTIETVRGWMNDAS